MSKKIRVLALGLIQDGDCAGRSGEANRLFLSQGYDPIKQETFYRALGGGVDFGEQSRQALEREFMEEIQATLINIQYLGCLESIFVHQDKPGHEIIQLYKCDFADPKFYQIEQLTFKEGKREKIALWVPLARVLSGELILYPETFLDYCVKLE